MAQLSAWQDYAAHKLYLQQISIPLTTKARNYIVINHFLFRIDMQKDRDLDKGNLFLLVIPEKYNP